MTTPTPDRCAEPRVAPRSSAVLRAIVATPTAMLAVTAVLHAAPRYFLNSRAFTLLLIGFVTAVVFRFGSKLRSSRLIRRPIAAGVGAMLATVLTGASACYLEVPLWMHAGLSAYCAKAGHLAAACDEDVPGMTARKAPGDVANTGATIPVYLVSHGWHTSLSFPTSEIAPNDWPAGAEFKASPWFDVGWGSAEFFQADEITAGIALRAFFVPSPSVLHVARLGKDPEATFIGQKFVRFDLDRAAFQALVHHVSDTVALDRDGKPQTTGKGDYGPESRFIAANGAYYFPETCNVWSARGLLRAGVPVVPSLAVTAENLMAQAARFGRQPPTEGSMR